MNYISQLQADKAELLQAIATAQNELTALLVFLHSPKFTGVDSNGERKDWIATADVIIALNEIKNSLPIEQTKQNIPYKLDNLY